MAEAAQPSLKTMAVVKNRNNITDMSLAKQIRHFERQRSLSILSIDHDRLDMKDFLRDIKKCGSDDLPEARHWLGQHRRRKKQREEMTTVRSSNTAPALRSTETDKERNVKSAPETKDRPDLSSSGVFKSRKASDTGKVSLYTIFSRRAEMVDAGPTWQTQPPAEDQKSASVKFGASDAIDAVAAENMARGGQDKVDILVVNRDDQKESQHKHGHSDKTNNDFMKELLVNNASKKYKKRKSKPIQDRLTDFYTKLDHLKQQEALDVPSAKETRRKYILLTQGVKAALQYSSDEEEVPNTHTI